MTIVRRVALLAVVSVTGIALLAPLAAQSASSPQTIALADHILVDASPQAESVDRSLLSARGGGPATTAGSAEALDPETLPTPASAPMEATLHGVATPKPAASAPSSQRVVRYNGDTVWDDLARCESGGNWAINSGNGYYGGLQFSLGTWQQYGGTQYAGYPHQATREEQIATAERLHAARGFAPWPACRAKLGLP